MRGTVLKASHSLFVGVCMMWALTLSNAVFGQDVPAPAIEPAPPEDLLTLAKGAVLVSASVDPARALALTDGDDTSNWNSSTKRNPPPYEFVFELIAESSLTQVGIDGSGKRPGGVAGGSAKSVRVEGSVESAEAGYVELARIEAAPDGVTLGDVSLETPVR